MRLVRDWPILALMVMQITIWASLFYSFPALVLHWQEEFGWSAGQTMGAFTLSIAIYALGAPAYGRLIDRGLAPLTFPLGGLVGAILLASVGFVDSLAAFYLIWAAIGVCMGLTLYEACFAIVTRARGAGARPAITAITLVAGFASTLAYPLTHAVAEAAGWRAAIYVMAALIVLINVPLSTIAIRRLEAEARAGAAAATSAPGPALPGAPLLRDARYWPLALGFALAGLTSGIFLSHLLPMMAAQGIPADLAILAAACIGPSQVAGRLAMLAAGSRVAPVQLAQLAMLTLAAGAVFMAGAGWVAALVLGFALCQGAGYGVVGILRAVLTREVLGQKNFGALSGAVSLPALLAFALAPFLAALIVDLAGYGPVIALCLLAPVAGSALLRVTARQLAAPQPGPSG